MIKLRCMRTSKNMEGLLNFVGCSALSLLKSACYPCLLLRKLWSLRNFLRLEGSNNSWTHITRKGQLTTSNLGSVLKIIRITPSPLKPLLGEYNLSRVKTVQWGWTMKRKLSKHSPSELVRQSKKQASGSIPLGILGTSQDGVDNKIVLEVKCQYTERN
ncbi:hypothetical protein pdam_00021748, partial [Pocillopora damicornis]